MSKNTSTTDRTKKAAQSNFVQKSCSKIVDEIDSCKGDLGGKCGDILCRRPICTLFSITLNKAWK